MSYCSKCGTALNEGDLHCSNCGAACRTIPIAPTRSASLSIHCPSCKGKFLTPLVESTNNGGTAIHAPVTRSIGVTRYTSSTTHRNYWMCQNCGTKFRNLKNLEEELLQEEKKAKSSLIMSLLSGIVTLIALFSMMEEPGLILIFGLFFIALVFMTIYLLVFGLSANSKVNQLTAEKEYLQANCFDN